MTSQIFANIYLNEFDRFTRHEVKPRGYLRYGDDFVLFVDTKEQAEQAKEIATQWLLDKLRLKVHIKNNIVVKANRGLLFLGHQIYPSSGISIDRCMVSKIERKISQSSAGTYQAMYITKRQAKRLPWLLRELI